MSTDATKEFEAIQTIHGALLPLEEDARSRVLSYIGSLLGVAVKATGARGKVVQESDDDESAGDSNEGGGSGSKGPQTFSSFAELYDAVSPKSNGEKALAVGYWLQVCQQADTFTAAAANKELMHLGHKVANITDAIDSFKDQKPSLILQLKKSGNSRQARKTYKVSHAGVKRIEEMLGG